MPARIKHFSVNWEDGMKINKTHFLQQDKAMQDLVRSVGSGFLNKNNYGLLPLDSQSDRSIKVDFKMDNQEFLRARIFQCQAFCKGGTRIEIVEDQLLPELQVNISKELEAAKSGDESDYYILLSVDIFNRQTFGELNAEEEPPRYPFTIPSFKLNIISEKQLDEQGNQSNSFFIGKMNVNKDKAFVYEDYIPPCMAVNSHLEVVNFCSSTEKFFSKLEVDVLSIIRKIKEKKQDSNLAQSVLVLAEQLLNYVTVNHLKLKWEIPDSPPLLLFEFIANAGRVIKNTLDSNTSANKEELMNYFTNWSELKQGDFEKLLVYCINFDYRHYDILISIEQFSEFIQIISLLFDKLESLAYIGKKKETNIFVKEQKTKRSFLAD